MEHTILVVEDEQGIREAIGIYMKNQGYNVILAANGKEGLEKIETNDIHLAISFSHRRYYDACYGWHFYGHGSKKTS